MRTVVCFLLLSLAAFGQKRQSDEFPARRGVVKITPIYHASLLIEAAGQALYVDPTGQGNYEGLPPADLILLTDIHGDHFDPKTVERLKKAGTAILGPQAVADKMAGVTVIRNGEVKNVGDWRIEALPAYNIRRGPAPGKLYHDKGRGNGYLLTWADKRFYISGDTEAIPEMKALKNIDVAFVCMNLPYTMPPEEAAEAVRALGPKVVYPYHCRNSDLSVFEKGLASSGIEVRIRNWYGL